ncbi:hypothetical protein G4Z05_00595 [Bacillus thermocopriae]|uniref:Uncharacterized protein n=1 Tax=Neobacillus thermocopriae TaxID=1215031 RepID=A0A6B3TM57_9BACI|nr:hypothetical protein [Neobacillus thermocopriae]NEX77399.1 hypothetical protein [Neobacillus thermocopriae]
MNANWKIFEQEKTLEEIFKDYPNALRLVEREIERVKNEEKIVGIDPESWMAKEILWQSKRLIDIENDVNSIKRSISRIENYLIPKSLDTSR